MISLPDQEMKYSGIMRLLKLVNFKSAYSIIKGKEGIQE